MSDDGVTDTLEVEPPEGVNLTVRLDVKKPVPANVKVVAKPFTIVPVTELSTALTDEIFNQLLPSE